MRKEEKLKEKEKRKDTHLNAEFQRIERREKKAFLSDQCKEIEENNRMGKTRDLFKKIRDTKGAFHAKMASVKNRKCMDLKLSCWRRLLRVPWTARRSNQSILKEISRGCSLERLMLKLKLQYCGHLM